MLYTEGNILKKEYVRCYVEKYINFDLFQGGSKEFACLENSKSFSQ